MTEPRDPAVEMESLLAAAIDGRLGESDLAKLERLLDQSDGARQTYLEQVILHAMLHWVHAAPLDDEAPAAAPASPALPILPVAVSRFTFSAPVGSLFFSYVLAAVIIGAGLLIGWASHLSSSRETFVQQPPDPPSALPSVEPMRVCVAHVTETIDCKSPKARSAAVGSEGIVLGQTFDLASGLMEIAYDSGAKVILQGPCRFTVNAKAGGYLTVGRITARVDSKPKPLVQAGNESQKQIAGQSKELGRDVPQFTVGTPTATITDLGTEFGVSVDKSGASETHVYRGQVEVLLAADGAGQATDVAAAGSKAVRLEANESAKVGVGGTRVVKMVSKPAHKDAFVRRMPKRVSIQLFNTGIGLKVNRPDAHWQLAARSDHPGWKPRPAVVTDSAKDGNWIANRTDLSQWISATGEMSIVPDGAVYTFRTTFDLTGLRPATAVVRGRFAADNHVRAIRLNGRQVTVPAHSYREFGLYHPFTADRGFVEGVNTLEIDVENGEPGMTWPSSSMGLIVELEGSAVTAWPGSSNETTDAKRKASRNQ